jgi:ATP-dependent exoDNAse (exonuclease V) alpha subunit
LREKVILESHRGRRQKGGQMQDLPYKLEIAIRMMVMVTDNVETDLDITNGARGDVVDIILRTSHLSITERLVPVGGKMVRRTVLRRQYLITAAYACTDYRSQGQTIVPVVMDIATPPTGGLSLFNLYVALSRSAGWSTIRLLRDFDEKVFEKAHDRELMREDERLAELDRQTKVWYEEVVQRSFR